MSDEPREVAMGLLNGTGQTTAFGGTDIRVLAAAILCIADAMKERLEWEKGRTL